MPEWIRNYWFVILIALIMIGFTGYYIYDSNRDNVTVKSSNGQDVVATLKDADITAEQLYDQGAPFDAAILYNVYKNAVISQTVENTSDIEEAAKNMQTLIRQNAQQQSDNYQLLLTSELASRGFESYDDLYDYCLVAAKENELDKTYISEHFDQLKEAVEKQNPRIISVISMLAADPENLSEDEKKKQENIDKMINEESFAKAATALSEDVNTAANEGLYGYVDSTTTALDAAILDAASKLEKDGVSDWITVTDSQSGQTYLYKVKVDETDLATILKNDSKSIVSSVVSSFIANNPTMQADAIEEAASKLDIKFENEETETKLKDYIKNLQTPAASAQNTEEPAAEQQEDKE